MEGEHRWDFLAQMSEIFVQRILILVKTIQKYIFWFWHPRQKCCKCCNRCLSFWFLYLSRDILVSFFSSDTEPFFLKVRENCTVTPKASYSLSRAHTADSLHTRITVFRGFQREHWSRKELKYFFCRCRREKANQWMFLSRLKMLTARLTPQPQRRHSSFLNNLVYCDNRNVEPFTQFHSSSSTSSFLTSSSSKEPSTRTCISPFFSWSRVF